MQSLGHLRADRGEEEGDEIVFEKVGLEVELDQLEARIGAVQIQCGLVEGLAMLLSQDEGQGRRSALSLDPASTMLGPLTSEIFEVSSVTTLTLPSHISSVLFFLLSLRQVPSTFGNHLARSLLMRVLGALQVFPP